MDPEMDMLRSSERIRMENTRGTACLRWSGGGDSLRRCGHVQGRDSEDVGRRILRRDLPGRMSRGRPETGHMDVVREDVKVAGVI